MVQIKCFSMPACLSPSGHLQEEPLGRGGEVTPKAVERGFATVD